MVPIFQLSYCSVSQGCADSTDRRIDQRAILQASLKHNPAVGVTGALLCGVNFYAQVLEGEHDAVTPIFERIEADRRHTAIVVLSAGWTRQRHYPHWSMAAIDLSGSQNSSIERIMSRAHSGEKSAVPLLHTLLERLAESEPAQIHPAQIHLAEEATAFLGRSAGDYGGRSARHSMG